MPDVVIVTTENTLRTLIDGAVERAVRCAYSSLVEDAGHETEWVTPAKLRCSTAVTARHCAGGRRPACYRRAG